MMAPKIQLFQKIVQKWPGKRIFGIYRFMPLFFLMGATVEFAMIKWRPLGVNFYDVYQDKEARKIAEQTFESQSQNSNSNSTAGN